MTQPKPYASCRAFIADKGGYRGVTSYFSAGDPTVTVVDPPAVPDTGHGGSRRRSYIVLLIALLVVTGFSQTPPGRALLGLAGVTASGGAYSELAFGAPKDLPRELFPGDPLPPLPFVVRNVTGETHTYRWTVGLAGAADEHRVAAGHATVIDGSTVTIMPSGRVVCAAGPVRVTVRLDEDHVIAYQAVCADGITGRQG